MCNMSTLAQTWGWARAHAAFHQGFQNLGAASNMIKPELSSLAGQDVDGPGLGPTQVAHQTELDECL